MASGPRGALPRRGRRSGRVRGAAVVTAPLAGCPDVVTEEVVFTARGNRLAATKVRPAGGAEPTVLTLHGFGTSSTRHSIRYVLDHLAGHGHASMCFEFSGNGDSTGTLADSSLARRCDEALAAWKEMGTKEPPVL